MPDFLKTLLLLQFLFDHSEIYTGETRHIVPPYNKAGISNFCLEFQKLQKYCRKRYSSLLIRILEKLGILCHRFLENATPPSVLGETRHIVPKPEFQIFAWNSRNCAEMPDFLKMLLLLQFLFDHSEIYTGETRHIVPPYNKAGISNFC